MATNYAKTLAALDDLPARGATVFGEKAAAYRIARRLLTPEGGLADVIEEDSDEWPELNALTLDLREWCGLAVSAADIRDLEARIVAVVSDAEDVSAATAAVTFADRVLSVTVDAVGAEGPFSFVLDVSAVSSSVLRVL